MPDAKKLFETLVREHADMLMVYLRAALGDVPEVDDLFQETMIVAWRRLDDFDQTRSFAAWLRGIARHLLSTHHRQQFQRRCTTATLDQLECRLAQLGRQQGDSWQEKLSILEQCVQALPDHYRDVVTTRYFQQVAVHHLCSQLSISLDAAKKRLQRTRALILDCMKHRLLAHKQ